MDLAIVIPAYKITYLDEALNSLAKQTNKNFNIYVGDDCSPSDIKSICDKYHHQLSIDYYRFDNNLGGTNLVQQWERCVDRIKDEKWIWVFSDDDVAEETCVAKFYQTITETAGYYDVYRFNTCVIDAHGIIISASEESPTIENAMDLAINILLSKRGNSMPDHIFKRDKYIELNGFIDFVFAQSSDWATSINYSYDKGLCTISGPKVRWRYSGENISSLASRNKKLLIRGYMQFLRWVTTRFNKSDEKRFNNQLENLTVASIKNFKFLIKEHYKGLPYSSLWGIAKELREIYQISFLKAYWLCLSLNLKIDRRRLKKVLLNRK